jgi:hypothetical protein
MLTVEGMMREVGILVRKSLDLLSDEMNVMAVVVRSLRMKEYLI